MYILTRTTLLVCTLLLAAIVVSACSSASQPSSPPALPAFVHQHPAQVGETYQLAFAHREVLDHIPCYCGCGAVHDSVRACFVADVHTDGSVEWDMHGSGCGICQHIVQDSVRLLNDGTPLADIRSFIDNKYSSIGPPTNTPLFPE